MANLQIVPFTFGTAGNMGQFGVFGGQSGDRINLTIGTHVETPAFTAATMVKLLAEADCVIRIGVDALATASTGDTIKAGIEVARYVKQGELISVVAAA